MPARPDKKRRAPRRRAPSPLPRKLTAPSFPPELPISSRIDEIVELLRAHQVLVVAGETGSGKTTQLPKACLAAGLGGRGLIGHTQPRRLAARTVAARIAEELGVALGAEVGFAVRFAERASAATVVKVMTDGLLLAELQRDPRLGRYECVIVDEAHERSLNVDFLLGALKSLLRRRRDLKVIVTSATIDVAAFARHFGDAPVVEISGRGHPVQTVYRPADSTPEHALADCLETIAAEAPVGRRDVLVFQSGEREIFDSAQFLRRRFGERFEILPLYARLPAAEQQRIFAPGARQRVVLATNVAETSITVPNIGYVIDPGLARISRYSVRAKLQRLPVEAISQASARQRAGRCGRIAPGVCYRLYAESDFDERPAYTDPELKRTNLASVVLTMRAFRLGDMATFPFIDPPEPRAVADAVRLLHELEALKDDALTDVGRTMARLPVDPRLARMLVAANANGSLAHALIVVSALAAQDPRLRPLEHRAAADKTHAEFADSRSDFVAFVNLWRYLENARETHTKSGFRRLLERRYLSPARVREWRELHRQLLLACKAAGMAVKPLPAVRAEAAPAVEDGAKSPDGDFPPQSAREDHAPLHLAILAGSLGFIGVKRPAEAHHGARKRRPLIEYDGPRNLRFRLFPGSGVEPAPDWIVAAEVSDTGQTFARCVARVDPAWIEAAGRHIAKRTFSEPRWNARRGEAVVSERVTVYGLPVVAARPKSAALVDAEAARDMFAHEALVGGDRRIDAPFVEHNRRLTETLRQREAKSRRSGLVASEREQAAFYLARLPDAVHSIATWRRFAARARPDELAVLRMTEADIATGAQAAFGADDFPGELRIGDRRLPLSYRFAPGEIDDGVNVRVGLDALAVLEADALDWLVPGFFEAKCVALVRALPKHIRRRLAPAPDRVAAALSLLLAPDAYRFGRLLPALSDALFRTSGIAVPVGEWQPDALPPHLRINVQVMGEGAGERKGERVGQESLRPRGGQRASGRRGGRSSRRTALRLLDQDRDLEALRSRLLPKVAETIDTELRARHERYDMVEFPADGVPPTLTVRGRYGGATAYPVLADRGSGVDLLLHATPTGRDALNRFGYARLALLAEARLARTLKREVEHDGELALHFAALGAAEAQGAADAHAEAGAVGGTGDLADVLLLASAWRAYFEDRSLPATRAEFDDRLAAGNLSAAFRHVFGHAKTILARRFAVALALARLDSPAFAQSRTDLATQLGEVVPPNFLTTPSDRLGDLARYLDGMAMRIENLPGRVPRDLAALAEVAPWQERLDALRAAGVDTQTLWFLVQEFRIATFCQRLGTRERVSPKRLETMFGEAEREAGVG